MNDLNEIKDKHIGVTENTYRRIKARGKFGESFDDVIQRLLKEGKTTKEIFQED